MKWYTCCNDAGLRGYGEGLLAACNSCLTHTSLEPVLVYDGQRNALTDHLEALGVRVILTRLSFGDQLREAGALPGFDLKWASGVFLRFDVPLFEEDDRYILYTDTDVIFCREFDLRPSTGALYAANEIILIPKPPVETKSAFNAGVMMMNVPFFKNIHRVLVSSAVDIARGVLSVPWYDQGLLNKLLGEFTSPLSMDYNHRPYFPRTSNPSIIHFQCIKPAQIGSHLRTGEEVQDIDLFYEYRDQYDPSLRLYASHLSDEGVRALLEACPDALLTNARG